MTHSTFIVTEKFPQAGLSAEKKVWKVLTKAFTDDYCLAYWRYPLFSSVGERRKEPDILLLHQEEGVVVIEVKALKIEQIHVIDGHLWQFNDFYEDCGNPYEQAESHLFSFLSMCERYPELRQRVTGRAVVALPNITRRQWEEKGFHQHPCCPPIIFKDSLLGGFRDDLLKVPPVRPGQPLDDGKWIRLCNVAGNTSVLKPDLKRAPVTILTTKSNSIAKARQIITQLDKEQEAAAKQIPDGPQRIRGIAGSGKTVLLCQKAAQIHLKHPSWDIALVFFTRSLYSVITELLDRYIRQFTNGEKNYNPKTSRLKVLHAWGAKDQPGLYGEACYTVGCRRRTFNPQLELTGATQLGGYIHEMYDWLKRHNKTIPPMFDVILIDEGQDLVVDSEHKTHGIQPFYWMAYNLCRPIQRQETLELLANDDKSEGSKKPKLRRLIWAYDEAQCLESPVIPTAREVFGDEQANMLKGQYEGGIRRSVVMHRCYRTPGPILTAAHAIGMGLLREEGMISGVTTQRDWQDLGYEVSGRFVPNSLISLHRPLENSPNPIPIVSSHPTLELKLYKDRQREAEAIAEKIHQDISTHKLSPEKQLLVVVFDRQCELAIIQAFRNWNIDYYIPSALNANERFPEWPHYDPNKFWHAGAVTISRIFRAKGNEAEMVYVMGLDLIASKESSLSHRNQLFVAMTRAKGWVHISGLNNTYPFYDEFKRVIEAEGRYNFYFKKAPQRDLSDQDLSPEWSRITTEVEDKYHPLVFKLAESLEPPLLYHKITECKRVIARPLLSWPDKKIAITQRAAESKGVAGWQIFLMGDVDQDLALFLEAFG